jgi:hypothetical protein
MEALPYYQWRVRDFRASRKVQRMGYIARGFYRELLDEEWLEGSLPADMAALAEICVCPVRVMEKAWPEILPCFREVDGRFINDKLESLRTEQDALRVKRKTAGYLGGIAKQNSADAKQVLASAEQVTYRREEERREEDIAPTSDEVRPVVSFPLSKAGEEYAICQAKCDELAKCYPAVDLVSELGKMRGWLLGNPKKRKTRTGIGRFIANWLSQAQDDAGKRASTSSAPLTFPPAQPVFEKRSNAIGMDQIRAQAGIQ